METLLKINEQLYGLPSGALVTVACVILGYLWRVMPMFPNKYIPGMVVLAGVILFMLVAPTRDASIELRVWIVRNFCIGMGTGFAAWMGHKFVLAKIEEKLGLFLEQPQLNTKPEDKP